MQLFKGFLFFAVTAAIMLLSVPAHGSSSLYLSLDGISGDSTNTTCATNCIDVTAWSLATSTNSLGGNVWEIAITKNVDSATPKVWYNCATGSSISAATLYVLRNDVHGTYLVITLSNVHIVGISACGSTNDTSASETIRLRFSSGTAKYTPYDSTGKPGSPIAISFTP